ncbi:hypothetical protein [Spirosoma sp.]|uniref:hypothetical protein n=1 Tax=Spirosoma sp. TaxID=1899569 RepID=UPI003B3A72A3
MTHSELCELRPGDRLLVQCRTSPADIFFKKKNDPAGRVPFIPTAGQINPFSYLIEGHFVELEYAEAISGDEEPAIRYVVLGTYGVGADLRTVNGKLKLVGSKLRQKQLHVPAAGIEGIAIYR